MRRKDGNSADPVKVYDVPKKLQKTKKSFELLYDETSERFVFKIIDVDSIFPLLIKVPSLEPRELIFTQNQKLHLT